MLGTLTTARGVLGHIWRHPANQGRRVRAIARALGFQVKGQLFHRPSVARVGANGKILCHLHSAGASSILYANPPDFWEMLFWRELLGEGSLFLDVGSNVGSYAIWGGDCGAEVWAFEPDPGAFHRLVENIRLNEFDISAHNVALGRDTGTMPFTVGLDTTNRFALDDRDREDVQQVDVDTIDNMLGGRPARGVKIDVEGGERLVLEGARSALNEHRIDVLQIEWNAMSQRTLGEGREPIAALLSDAGYILFRPTERGLEMISQSEAGAYGLDLFAASPTVAADLGLSPAR